MSTWESVAMSSGDVGSIPEPKFATVWRGYDRDEVSVHLERLAGRIRVLEHNSSELESELEQARKQGQTASDSAARGEAYETIAVRLADVLRAFDEDVERMRGEAQRDADRIVDEAKAEADRIRVDAQANAEELRGEAERAAKDAQEKADELLSDLESRRSSLLIEMRTLKDRMLDAAKAMMLGSEADQPTGDVVVAEESVTVSERAEEEPGSLSRGWSGSPDRPR